MEQSLALLKKWEIDVLRHWIREDSIEITDDEILELLEMENFERFQDYENFEYNGNFILTKDINESMEAVNNM